MCYHMKDYGSAVRHLENLLGVKARLYGKHSKQLVETAIQVMHASQTSADVESNLKRTERTYKLLKAVMGEAVAQLDQSPSINAVKKH